MKPGELVWLKSGGPAMTVDENYRADHLVSVQWFNGASLMRDAFPPDCLTQINPVIPVPFSPAISSEMP